MTQLFNPRRYARRGGTLVLLAACLIPSPAVMAQSNTADTCPTGFYRTSSGFCKAFSSDRDRDTVNQIGDRCPVGWYRSAEGYCRAYGTRTQERVVEKGDSGCPTGWYRASGGICKQR